MFFFFVVAPFCSCPASLVSRKFFAVGPGCAKCFFFCCAPLGAATFRRGQSKKKKHHPGCFFFAPAPGKGRGRRSPVPTRGQSKKKKHHPGCFFFFAAAPAKGKGRRSPVGRRHGARAKKKNTTQGVFFFAAAPARTLTHSLRAWVAMPPPRRGGVFFLLRPPPRTGVVFFFLLWPRPDAHSLTVGWGDFGKAPVVFFFFLLRPRRVFLDNSKKCLGYYIGSKKTRRGHSKKKHHFP